MDVDNIYALAQKPDSCLVCEVAQACFAGGVDRAHLAELAAHLQAPRLVRRRQHLFRAGDASKGLFLVQSGCFKVYGLDQLGREYIAGFRLPGSILGLHSLYDGHHQFNAVALADSSVCALALGMLQSASARVPDFLKTFLRLVGQELLDGAFLTGDLSAEERLVSFLLRFASKLHADVGDGMMYLYMTRGDIASYLRLAPATVSRILTKLQGDGVIDSDYHHIRILDYARLKDLGRNIRFASLGQIPA